MDTEAGNKVDQLQGMPFLFNISFSIFESRFTLSSSLLYLSEPNVNDTEASTLKKKDKQPCPAEGNCFEGC
jgi:hypothetical protein